MERQISDVGKNSSEWFKSKGYTITKVKCASCGKGFDTVVEKGKTKESIEKDSFWCEKNCRGK